LTLEENNLTTAEDGIGKEKGKTKFYFSELAEILSERPKVAKKLINKMIEDQILGYWFSDSMSLYRLKRIGNQAVAEH
jgi:hypothetical protein